MVGWRDLKMPRYDGLPEGLIPFREKQAHDALGHTLGTVLIVLRFQDVDSFKDFYVRRGNGELRHLINCSVSSHITSWASSIRM